MIAGLWRVLLVAVGLTLAGILIGLCGLWLLARLLPAAYFLL